MDKVENPNFSFLHAPVQSQSYRAFTAALQGAPAVAASVLAAVALLPGVAGGLIALSGAVSWVGDSISLVAHVKGYLSLSPAQKQGEAGKILKEKIKWAAVALLVSSAVLLGGIA